MNQELDFPEALTLPEQAKAIVITDAASYQVAANFKITLAGWRKKITDEFKPMKDAAHKAHKAITEKEGSYLKPITDAELLLRTSLVKWQDEQERIRRAEQMRLEAEARQRAEAERQQREEAALQEAIAVGSDEVFVEPAPIEAPVIAAPTYEPVKGLGIKRTWAARVDNMRELCAAIGRGEVSTTYVAATAALNERARADKGELKIPGVTAVWS